MRPERGTPEFDLWIAAIDVAAAAPLEPRAHVHMAQIPWSRIRELRSAFDQLGIDWRGVKRAQSAHKA